MSDTAKQLQAPYRVEDDSDSVWIMDAVGKYVAVMAYKRDRHDEQVAHAEAIVHALNCHDSLLEACKALRQQLWRRGGKFLTADHIAMDLARDAIAKAEPNP